MAWETDLVLMTRALINDLNSPQKYTDSYLQRVIIAAAILVRNDIELPYSYSLDIANLTIAPDPVSNQDTISQALFPLKAACIINQGDFQKALGQGIKVRDGDSSIDTSVSFRGYRDILQFGPCAAYENLRWKIQASSSSVNSGGAVIGPFRSSSNSVGNTVEWFYDNFLTFINTGRCR